MSINKTLNYLFAQRSNVLICFSGAVTTSTVDLKCAGGESGDGLPLPSAARIYRVDCWDGTTLVSDTDNVKAEQGERISVRAVASGGAFDVTVRLNGNSTTLVASGALQNATLMVTVHLRLIS